MYSKYFPVSSVSRLLRDYSKEFRKKHCYSMWYFDKENNKIVICSTRPGFWIGRMGETINKLTGQCNELIHKYNECNKKFVEDLRAKKLALSDVEFIPDFIPVSDIVIDLIDCES